MKNRFFIGANDALKIAFASVAAMLFSVAIVSAATTISTSITTGGTLTVTGLSSLNGNASTTGLTSTGNVWVNGFATTTASNGNFATQGTLAVTGLSTLANASTTILSTTGNFMVNGFATTTASNGNFATQGTLAVTGISTLTGAVTTGSTLTVGTTASSTSLIVGNDMVSTINGMIFGFCTIPSTTVNATSTAYANCTGATGVTSSYRVFMQATSSMPAGVVIEAASSTATTGTINVQLLNAAVGANSTFGPISFNFWALR